jgi:hypothetical protein
MDPSAPDDDTTPQPKPQVPRVKPAPLTSSESLGSWADPTDMADRQAFEDARREQAGERPPHY